MKGRVTCGPSIVRCHVTVRGGVQSPVLCAHKRGADGTRHRQSPRALWPLWPETPLASVNSSGSAHSDGFIPTLLPTQPFQM